MINVKRAAAEMAPQTRRFWLLNLAFIVLYLWTLGETTAITVEVRPNYCTAHTPQRSIAIPCADLDGEAIQLYRAEEPAASRAPGGLLHWLAPSSAWQELRVARSSPSDFVVQAGLRRAHGSAGIVLLQQGAGDGPQHGLAFVATAAGRRAEWWRWQDGALAEPIRGIPFQKPALAQLQSLLRLVLNAHHAALLLAGVAWLLSKARRALARRPAARVRTRTAAWPARAVCIPILLLVFGLTVHIAADVLERIPHVQDSVTYLFQARTLARGALSAPAPTLPQAFEQQFLLVRDGAWFGKYPPGYPLVLALGVLAGAPWLVNPLLATLTAALFYALARRLYPAWPGLALAAAGALLVSPFFLFMSGSHMAHSAELLWMAALIACWVVALRRGSRRAAVAAGLAFGALFLTRQLSAVAAALPLMAVSLLCSARMRGGQRFLAGLKQALVAGTAALPFLLLLLGHQWALTGDPRHDPRLLYWPYDTLGFGRDIGEGQNAFELEMSPQGLVQTWYTDASQPPRGHSLARGLYNVQQNWLALEQDLFGWLPAFTLAFLWLAFLLNKPRAADWSLLAILVGLIAAYLFYWADGISYGPRYFFVALPAFVLLTLRGAQSLAAWLGGRSGQQATGALVLLLVCGALLINSPRYLRQYQGYNFVDRQALTLLENDTEKPALVFVSHGPDWWRYGQVFSANSPWLDGPLVVARDLGPRLNRDLMRHFPERQLYRLDQNGLQAVPRR